MFRYLATLIDCTLPTCSAWTISRRESKTSQYWHRKCIARCRLSLSTAPIIPLLPDEWEGFHGPVVLVAMIGGAFQKPIYCLYLRDCVTYVCRNMAALAPLEMAGIMPVCLTTCTDSELYAIKHPSSTPISIDSQRLQPIYPQHCAASIRTKCCGSFLLPIRLLLLSDLKILYHIVRPAPPLDR